MPFLLSLLITAGCLAQPALKLYGYSQSHLPGMVPKGTKGNGSQENYYVYLQHKTSDKISPEELYVKGVRYSFSQKNAPLPVMHSNNNIPVKQVNTVLVPANGLKTIAVNTGNIISYRGRTSKKLISENELVISYTWKGKHYYKMLKKLTVLEPQMEQ
jgi:hypothetical protein